MGDSGLLLLMEKEIFLSSKELPSWPQRLEQCCWRAPFCLTGYLQTPDPFSPTPYSFWELSRGWGGLERLGWRQDEAKEGQPGCFHMNFPCMLKQIQTACEPGSPGEPSAPSGVGEHRNHLFAALVQCLLHYI